MALNLRMPEVAGATGYSPRNILEPDDHNANSVAALGQQNHKPTPPDQRAAKRTKVDGKITTTPRKRVPTACENCRLRKTKCDGVRPICGSCTRMGVECVGGDDKELSLYETTSLRILDGIERLESILRTQNVPPSSPADMGRLRAPAPTAVSPALSYKSTTSIATAIYEPPSPMPAIPTLFDSNSTSDTTSRMLKTPSKLDGVLAWSVFRRTWPSCGLASDENWKENPGEDVHLDPVSVRTLRELYLERFHPSYPIINIDILDKAIHSTFEGAQGCRWGSESCLMLLVCALGAVADDYRDHFYNRGSATDLQRSRVERITMAEGYWFMAQRRLGCVLSEESELAGQCLALAGFWYLYQLDPISAYKMFHSACLSWQTLHLAQGRMSEISRVEVDGVGKGMTNDQYLKQRLYWTCLKAEFELRAELSLPVPTGAQLEYPLHFPRPPESFGHLNSNRLWFFYTAEIFLRRLHNRVIDEVASFEEYLHDPHTALTEKRLASLITIVREYEVYISKWHNSLPSDIKFPDPASPTPLTPLLDERQQFIRKRFLDCHELLYRPFLNLTLNFDKWQTYIVAHPKSRSQPQDLGKLERDVRHFSTMALQYTYWSICADRGVWFHHSCTVWFDVRNRLADVLVLRAAAKAGLGMAMDWEDLVEEAENGLMYWCLADGEDARTKERRRRAGLQGCGDTVIWARDIIGL